MGNSHPSLFPYDAAADRRRRPDHHGRQRRAVPQALRGARRPRAGRRPAVRAATQDRTANREELRPLLVERLRDPDRGRVVPRAHRRRRPVRADQHRRRRGRLRRGARARPGRAVGEGAAAVPSIRNPITFSATPARYVPAAAGPGRARRGDPGLARCGRGPDGQAPTGARAASLPDLAGHVGRRPHPAARPGPGRRPDGQRSASASWRSGCVAGRRPTPRRGARVRGRARRARRPRLHPDRDRRPADLPVRARTRCRARWPPGCSAAARASSGSPRTPGGSSPTRWPRCDGPLPDRRRRLGRAGARRWCGAPGRPGGTCPASATRCTRCRTRARPRLLRDRRGGGPARPAPAPVRGDRPGAPAGARPDAAAQRRRRLRRGAGRPRACRSSCCAASRCSPARPGLLGQLAEERRRPGGDGHLPGRSTGTRVAVRPSRRHRRTSEEGRWPSWPR